MTDENPAVEAGRSSGSVSLLRLNLEDALAMKALRNDPSSVTEGDPQERSRGSQLSSHAPQAKPMSAVLRAGEAL